MRTRSKKQLDAIEANDLNSGLKLKEKSNKVLNLLKEHALYDPHGLSILFEKEIIDINDNAVLYVFRNEDYWFIQEMDKFKYIEESYSGYRTPEDETDLIEEINKILGKY